MEETFDVSNPIAAGIYFVRISGENESWVGNFIKE